MVVVQLVKSKAGHCMGLTKRRLVSSLCVLKALGDTCQTESACDRLRGRSGKPDMEVLGSVCLPFYIMATWRIVVGGRSEEHTSELQSR